MASGAYEIGGKKFTQQKLVWGQVKQLNEIIKGIQIPSAGLSPATLISVLGDKLPTVLAIIVREEGKSLKEKDLDALAVFMEDEAELDTIVQVVEDFFTINPITYIFEKLGVGIKALTKKLLEIQGKESTSPSASSPKET